MQGDTGSQITHPLKQGKVRYSQGAQPGEQFWITKQATYLAAIVSYMCMQQPMPSARRDILLDNNFYKTSDFADGPTLAATTVRTGFCVPPALQTAPSEHPPLSPYQVICYSFA